MRFFIATLLFAALIPFGRTCWNAIEPAGFAAECPIIVAGTIESVVQPPLGGQRADDIAQIRIDAVHRNELTDVALEPGDLLAVKMISRNNSIRISTDLNYPALTRAVWLVMLTSQGEFRIDVHPVQKQPFDERPKLGLAAADVKLGVPPDGRANPQGSKTQAEWVAWKKNQEAQQTSEPDKDRAEP